MIIIFKNNLTYSCKHHVDPDWIIYDKLFFQLRLSIILLFKYQQQIKQVISSNTYKESIKSYLGFFLTSLS